MDNSPKPERKTKMRNISIFDNWQIKEQNRQNRMRVKDFKRCSLENDLWKIEEQNEQNLLKTAEYEQSVKALQKYIDHTKMMDQCMNSTN